MNEANVDTISGLKRFRLGGIVANGEWVDVEIEVETQRLMEYIEGACEKRDRHGAGSITLCDGIVLMVKD